MAAASCSKLSLSPCRPAVWRRAAAGRRERGEHRTVPALPRCAPGRWHRAGDRAAARPHGGLSRVAAAATACGARADEDDGTIAAQLRRLLDRQQLRRRLAHRERAAGTEQLRVDFAAPRVDNDRQRPRHAISRLATSAITARLETPTVLAFEASARARAAATPMRVPVKVPGPIVTAMRSSRSKLETAPLPSFRRSSG